MLPQGREVVAHLQDGWSATPVKAGDTVHLLAPLTPGQGAAHHATLTHSDGLLIVHPDILLSGRISLC